MTDSIKSCHFTNILKSNHVFIHRFIRKKEQRKDSRQLCCHPNRRLLCAVAWRSTEKQAQQQRLHSKTPSAMRICLKPEPCRFLFKFQKKPNGCRRSWYCHAIDILPFHLLSMIRPGPIFCPAAKQTTTRSVLPQITARRAWHPKPCIPVLSSSSSLSLPPPFHFFLCLFMWLLFIHSFIHSFVRSLIRRRIMKRTWAITNACLTPFQLPAGQHRHSLPDRCRCRCPCCCTVARRVGGVGCRTFAIRWQSC